MFLDWAEHFAAEALSKAFGTVLAHEIVFFLLTRDNVKLVAILVARVLGSVLGR